MKLKSDVRRDIERLDDDNEEIRAMIDPEKTGEFNFEKLKEVMEEELRDKDTHRHRIIGNPYHN